jgi:hypothetical protein
MPAEIITLIDNQDLLVGLLFGAAVGLGIGMTIEKFLSEKRRAAWRTRNPHWQKPRWEKREDNIAAGPWGHQPDRGTVDAADQLRIVMAASFTIRPLLNKREARVFKELDLIVIGRNPTWQVMAQVSLGEILRSKDSIAFSCINSKRVDLLLVDGDCRPRHAIEYQGEGHHQGTAAARDAIKKEALRRAGIGYHEVVAGHTTPADLRRLVERLVDEPVAAGPT